MRAFDAILRAVPLPIALVAAALLVHALPALPPESVAVALSCAGGLGLVVLPRLKRHAMRLLVVGVAGASWTLVVADHGLAQRLEQRYEGRDYVVAGHVVSMPLAAERGTRFVFAVERCVLPAEGCPVGRRLRLGWHAFGAPGERGAFTAVPAPQPGERWQLNVRLKRVHALHNPHAFDAELRALEEGIAANGYVRAPGKRRHANETVHANERLAGFHWTSETLFESARARLRDAMSRALAGARADASGVLMALVVGDQAAIPPAGWDVFNRTGVGHLMSISGLHITMLAGIAVALARRALATSLVARSGLLLRWPARRIAWLCGVLAAFLYAGLSGWGIPAQRTCWMLAVAGLALCSGRTRSIGRVLALAAGVVTVLDPWAPLAAGFWLSFAAVAAIALHASATRARVASRARATLPRARALLEEALRTQWAATLALLPLGAMFFASVSLVGPLANAFAIPLVSAVITPVAIAAAALLPWLETPAALLLHGVATPTGWLLDALAALAAAPWAIAVLSTPTPAALLLSIAAVVLLLLPVRLPGRPMAFAGLLPLISASSGAPPAGAIRITALDVGQGMTALVETPERRLLYDAGPLYGGDSEAGLRVILPYLRSRGIDHLDALIVSHPDSDHSGGAASLLRGLRIDWIAGSLPEGHPVREAGLPFYDCRRGQRWRWGEVSFEFLHPGPETPRGGRSSTNASSCVLRVVAPAARVLLTGDIEAAQERALVERFGAAGLQSEGMLVPHHGSATSSSAAFLRAVGAHQAIAQLGYRNRFHHPAARVVERYREAGIEWLRSDRDGAITIEYALGQPPRISRSRIDDRRYWRIRVDDTPPPDGPAPAGSGERRPTARSSRRRCSRRRRAPDRPRASTGTRRARRVARG